MGVFEVLATDLKAMAMRDMRLTLCHFRASRDHETTDQIPESVGSKHDLINITSGSSYDERMLATCASLQIQLVRKTPRGW